MNGQEIKDMILRINAEAKSQGGVLQEIALPVELYEALCRFENKGPWGGEYPASIDLEGIKVHTGEND